MNGYSRRSVIVAVALAATLSAGAALAADTGLPPGFAKTDLTSPAASGMTSTSAASVGRLAAANGTLTSVGFGPDLGDSPLVDLTALAAALSGGERTGLTTGAASGVTSTSAASVGRLAAANGVESATGYRPGELSSTLGNGTIAAVARALQQSDEAGLATSTDYPKIDGGDSRPSNPNPSVGPGTGPLIPISPTDPSYPFPPLGPPGDAMVNGNRASAGFAANRDGSSQVDLTALAAALSGSEGAGLVTQASSPISPTGVECGPVPIMLRGGERAGLATRAANGFSSTSAASVGRLAAANGTLTSVGFGPDLGDSPLVDLTALAAALSGN
jgi:hypothetical protein